MLIITPLKMSFEKWKSLIFSLTFYLHWIKLQQHWKLCCLSTLTATANRLFEKAIFLLYLQPITRCRKVELGAAPQLEYWSNGVLKYWSIGVMECWSVGVMGSIERLLNIDYWQFWISNINIKSIIINIQFLVPNTSSFHVAGPPASPPAIRRAGPERERPACHCEAWAGRWWADIKVRPLKRLWLPAKDG